MSSLDTIELKVFLPAKDFDLSRKFYQDIGFTVVDIASGDLAYVRHDNVSFLLQRFYIKEFAENLMMHLLVRDVDAWSDRITNAGIAEKYGVRISRPAQQPWKMRDFTLFDPSGVLWRIGENTE